ncbi:hypothetical protein [Aquimarina algiphila]|uniref:Uncharacterized protein n=1 Tax=Aquimarina algiphila TaxID=2047982 RepID=A0A554VA15_9FLAO|nr:hypothetical protein [Aquimarina algiphila]TSE02545.1 hypothetical protein FOF46_30780 [Aquimarina algiphila]
MRKGLKIGCFSISILLLVAIILGIIADKSDGPRQSFYFLNTSDATKSVTFEWIEKDGELSKTWYVDEVVKPNESIIKRIPEGHYRIQVWDQNDTIYKETKFKFALKNPDESNYELYRFDLAMDKDFVLVNLNALYSGGSFAEHMSNAVGTNFNQLKIEQVYKDNIPFLISNQYTDRTFIDIDDDLPSKVKYGEIVYGLFYLPSNLKDSLFSSLLYEKVISKTK